MKHLAAYLLLTLGGNTSPGASDIKEVLSAAGIDADDDRLTALLKQLEGKDINEVVPLELVSRLTPNTLSLIADRRGVD